MFDLSAALALAGDEYAIEWARLERSGVDPVSINEMAQCDVSPDYLPFMRARDRFFASLERCQQAGKPVHLRYKLFIQGGCKTNPGIAVPSIGLLSVPGIIIAMMMLYSLPGAEKSVALGVLFFSLGCLCLSWGRIWSALTYLKLRHERLAIDG